MANNDKPHGFKVYGKLLRSRLYAVVTNPTVGFYIGDMVAYNNTSIACTKGRGELLQVLSDTVIQATTGDANPVIGVVIGCYDENMFPCSHILAAETGDGTVAGYLLVADDPAQMFEAQEDGDTAAIAQTDVGLNFDCVATTPGNTTTGLSKFEIDSNSHATTVTLAFRVFGMAYPQEDTIGSAGCRWIVQMNPLAHLYGQGTAI